MKYRVGDLAIDAGRQSVTRGEAPIPLPKLSYDLLLVLTRAAPNVVTVDQLVREVWPGLVVSPETVSRRVTLLREALGEDAQAPRYIATLRGRGYHIVADVATEIESDAQAVPPTPAPANPPSAQVPRRSARKKTSLTVTAILIVSVAVVAWQYWAPHPQSAATTEISQPAQPRSIAVLPFVDLSERHDQQYLGDGMAEEIIHLLLQIHGIQVIGRTSSFQFKGQS